MGRGKRAELLLAAGSNTMRVVDTSRARLGCWPRQILTRSSVFDGGYHGGKIRPTGV